MKIKPKACLYFHNHGYLFDFRMVILERIEAVGNLSQKHYYFPTENHTFDHMVIISSQGYLLSIMDVAQNY
jgi:hypothetical protein